MDKGPYLALSLSFGTAFMIRFEMAMVLTIRITIDCCVLMIMRASIAWFLPVESGS